MTKVLKINACFFGVKPLKNRNLLASRLRVAAQYQFKPKPTHNNRPCITEILGRHGRHRMVSIEKRLKSKCVTI